MMPPWVLSPEKVIVPEEVSPVSPVRVPAPSRLVPLTVSAGVVPFSRTIFPVVLPPMVRVLLSRDWMVEVLALRTSPLLFPELAIAEKEATGVLVERPVKAKSALVVAVPPKATSTVLLYAEMVPGLIDCQKL